MCQSGGLLAVMESLSCLVYNLCEIKSRSFNKLPKHIDLSVIDRDMISGLTGTGTKNPELTGTGTGIIHQHLTGTGMKNVT